MIQRLSASADTEMDMDMPIRTMEITVANTVTIPMADTTTTALDTIITRMLATVTQHPDITPLPFGATQCDDIVIDRHR